STATVWWESQYDLSGSSLTVNIYNPESPPPNPPFMVFPHPMTGTLTVQWGAATMAAPITQGVLVGGFDSVDQLADAGLFVLTGIIDTVFLPPPWGTFGTLSGGDFTLSVVADSSVTGYLHCTFGSCALGGFVISIPKPQTPTGPGPFPITIPKWSFTGGVAGVDPSWTSSVITQTLPPTTDTPFTNILQVQYKGQEISRTFVPEPSFAALILPGLGLLGAMGWLRQRR
ncbi:MAG: PEP-CTERM sorting domain-containing protein, partial [Deltaproteobacteria bacterium]|nr:PEP-CTERM sorting domain-containing protein [Deltaproteobacteria bacterium]